ncbi:hypothetical protein, partial [Frankia casuarinae]
ETIRAVGFTMTRKDG